MVYDIFEDGNARTELETRLEHLQPVELLLPRSLSENSEKLLSRVVSTRYEL